MRFKQFIEAIISPSREPNTLSLYHGGNLEAEYKARKNRIEYLPGLYLTTHLETARKYQKGSRKLYLITIRKGKDLRSIQLPCEKAIFYVNNNVPRSKRRVSIDNINSLSDNGQINASTFGNMLLNNNAVKDGLRLKAFFIENGADYSIINNAFGWNERMIVLFNMSLIVDSKIIGPKDRFEVIDLPKEFN